MEAFEICCNIPPQGVLVRGQDLVDLVDIRGIVVGNRLPLVLIGIFVTLPHPLDVLTALLLHLLPALESVMLRDIRHLLSNDASKDPDELLHPPGVPV